MEVWYQEPPQGTSPALFQLWHLGSRSRWDGVASGGHHKSAITMPSGSPGQTLLCHPGVEEPKSAVMGTDSPL